MAYGTLHVKWPNGQTRDFPLDQSSISVGRAPDNDLALEEVSVSRHHARLSVEGGRLTVEDLGSANGTFVAGERIVANVANVVPLGQTLRLGDVEVRFTPPSMAPPIGEQETALLTVPVQALVQTEKVLPFEGFVMALQPVRGLGDFQLTVNNQGHAPVAYRLRGADDPLAEPNQALSFFFEQEAVSLQPGQQQVISIHVSPLVKPRFGSTETREFSIRATPLGHEGADIETAGQLIIRPLFPLWLVPVILSLCLCGCLCAGYTYFAFCPTYSPSLPFCLNKPVIKVFSATPAQVAKGDSVIVAWEVTSADSVEFVAPIEQPVATSGLQTFNPQESTIFTLRARNRAGIVEQSIVVAVEGAPPVIEAFIANPGAIIGGQTDKLVLSWTVVGAEVVSIEGVPAQTFDPQTGNLEIPAPTSTTIYTLVAANASGTLRQELQVTVTSAGCVVSNVSQLNMRTGPSVFYPVVETLLNGTTVEPVGRNATADWLRVKAVGKEGWVASDFITCGVAFNVFPTVDPAFISPPPPTLTPGPTLTPSLPPPPQPSTTPVFSSLGFVTYRVQTGGRTTIYLQGKTGGPIPLLADKDDAEVLDFTPNNGGRFAIWALESGVHKVYIVGLGGNLLGGPLTSGWTSVTDGDWSIDGQHLVIEAVNGDTPAYYYFDANGNLTSQPTFP